MKVITIQKYNTFFCNIFSFILNNSNLYSSLISIHSTSVSDKIIEY